MASSLKELSIQRPTLEDITKGMDGLKTAEPRVAAIVGSTYLEDVTHLSIVTRTIALKKEDEDRLYVGSAPLSSFSAKIIVAYALGLIGPKARHDLDRIREIRNAFAHAKIEIGFDTPAVVNAIESMHFKGLAKDWKNLKTQEKFSLVVRLLQIYLITNWITPTPDTITIRAFDKPAPVRTPPAFS